MGSRLLRSMGSRLLRSIARGYSYSQRRFLYPCSSATFQSLPNSAFASSPRPASWEPKPLFTPANIRFFAASPGSSKVLVVNSDLEFSNLLSKAQEEKSLAVAYFTAVWCGPCRTIAPLVDNLSASYPNVTFMKLDVDQENLSNTLRNSGVSSVPTFHFYKKGVKVADLIGADPVRLKEIIGNLSD